MTDLSRHTVSHLSAAVKTINLPGKSPTEENWGLVAHQPPIGLQYATICSTNNTNTEHKYAPRCDHEPAELPTADASIMDHSTVSMEPQMVRPCLLPMIRRTPPSSHLSTHRLHTVDSTDRRRHARAPRRRRRRAPFRLLVPSPPARLHTVDSTGHRRPARAPRLRRRKAQSDCSFRRH